MLISEENQPKLLDFGYEGRGDHYAKSIRWGEIRFRNTVHTIRVDKRFGTIYVQTDIGVYMTKGKVLPCIRDIMHLVRD